jgi:hypothetical protein
MMHVQQNAKLIRNNLTYKYKKNIWKSTQSKSETLIYIYK